jgi:DNA-directed RNA polymerase specialized sigma24 family protein
MSRRFVGEGRAADGVAVDHALTQLAELYPPQARLVELRFFGGLTIEEAAGALGISLSTARRNWLVAKAWLTRALRES